LSIAVATSIATAVRTGVAELDNPRHEPRSIVVDDDVRLAKVIVQNLSGIWRAEAGAPQSVREPLRAWHACLGPRLPGAPVSRDASHPKLALSHRPGDCRQLEHGSLDGKRASWGLRGSLPAGLVSPRHVPAKYVILRMLLCPTNTGLSCAACSPNHLCVASFRQGHEKVMSLMVV
jgi:hypothetical protein